MGRSRELDYTAWLGRTSTGPAHLWRAKRTAMRVDPEQVLSKITREKCTYTNLKEVLEGSSAFFTLLHLEYWLGIPD